jgi:hypothetical protein
LLGARSQHKRKGRVSPAKISRRTSLKEHVGDEPQLSPEWIKEIDRRVRDSRDPVRYMLVSEFSRNFILYYDATSDTYVMNDASRGTLFKRREVADSVSFGQVHSQGWQAQAALTFSRNAASYAERPPNPPSHRKKDLAMKLQLLS